MPAAMSDDSELRRFKKARRVDRSTEAPSPCQSPTIFGKNLADTMDKQRSVAKTTDENEEKREKPPVKPIDAPTESILAGVPLSYLKDDEFRRLVLESHAGRGCDWVLVPTKPADEPLARIYKKAMGAIVSDLGDGPICLMINVRPNPLREGHSIVLGYVGKLRADRPPTIHLFTAKAIGPKPAVREISDFIPAILEPLVELGITDDQLALVVFSDALPVTTKTLDNGFEWIPTYRWRYRNLATVVSCAGVRARLNADKLRQHYSELDDLFRAMQAAVRERFPTEEAFKEAWKGVSYWRDPALSWAKLTAPIDGFDRWFETVGGVRDSFADLRTLFSGPVKDGDIGEEFRRQLTSKGMYERHAFVADNFGFLPATLASLDNGSVTLAEALEVYGSAVEKIGAIKGPVTTDAGIGTESWQYPGRRFLGMIVDNLALSESRLADNCANPGRKYHDRMQHAPIVCATRRQNEFIDGELTAGSTDREVGMTLVARSFYLVSFTAKENRENVVWDRILSGLNQIGNAIANLSVKLS